MNMRLPLVLSAALVSSLAMVSTAHADPPPNHQHGGGAPGAGQQHGNAPANNAPAANNNMAGHGNQPNNNNGHPGDNRGGGALGVNVNVNVGAGVGGGGFGGRPVVRGAPIVYDDRMRQENDARLANREIARRNAAVWESGRFAREEEHRRELEGRWGRDFYYRPECREEIALDSYRTARLVRIIDIAQDNHDPVLASRARALLARENARHAREMIGLRIRLGYQ